MSLEDDNHTEINRAFSLISVYVFFFSIRVVMTTIPTIPTIPSILTSPTPYSWPILYPSFTEPWFEPKQIYL